MKQVMRSPAKAAAHSTTCDILPESEHILSLMICFQFLQAQVLAENICNCEKQHLPQKKWVLELPYI